MIVAVGQSLQDRDQALSSIVSSFALGGPLAVVLASGIGYLLAAAGLVPVERMRRRARGISLRRPGERLPLPAAHDELWRLGETLNEMLDRLEQSLERERRFVADASHELRTIAVVKTELEGALRTGDYGAGVRDALAAAVEECDHLGQLAEDLLVIAPSAEGALPVRREALAVRPVLESMRQRFADRAERHHRRIRILVKRGLELKADPLSIRQALGNLVDNALRHGAGEIALSYARGSGGVELAVTDEARLWPRDRRTGLRTIHARRPGSHPRWRRAGNGHRARSGRGPRRARGDRCRPRRDREALATRLAAVSGGSQLGGLRSRDVDEGRRPFLRTAEAAATEPNGDPNDRSRPIPVRDAKPETPPRPQSAGARRAACVGARHRPRHRSRLASDELAGGGREGLAAGREGDAGAPRERGPLQRDRRRCPSPLPRQGRGKGQGDGEDLAPRSRRTRGDRGSSAQERDNWTVRRRYPNLPTQVGGDQACLPGGQVPLERPNGPGQAACRDQPA
jgi:hypothetical protein